MNPADPASRDAFCAAALLLGMPAGEVEASLGGPAPPWLRLHASAGGSQARAAQLSPRLLALRIAVERARISWR